MHIAQWCHLRNSSEGQNIQRNTGGIDTIPKNATMGTFKLYKYSLSKFQWWFWISQLPSRTSKSKSINPNNFECRIALEGEGGSVGNSYIGTVQTGSISKAFFFFFLDCCLLLFGSVLWCSGSGNHSKLSVSMSPHLCIISSSGAENPVAVKSPAAAKILMHFQFPVH